jgi:hypothetical protein
MEASGSSESFVQSRSVSDDDTGKESNMRWQLQSMIVLVLMLASTNLAEAADPSLTVVAPADGAVVDGGSVTVSFRVSDFKIVPSPVPVSEFGKRPDLNRPNEGHIHLVLDLQPLVVWGSEESYTFDGVAPGEHLLKVELANNDHSSLAPPVVRTVRFQVREAQTTPAIMPRTSAASGTAGSRVALFALAMLLCGSGIMLRRRRRSE